MSSARQISARQGSVPARKPYRLGAWRWGSALLLLYPAAIWWLLPRHGSGALLVGGAALLGLRAWQSGQWLIHSLLALSIGLAVVLGGHELGLRLYPVAVNIAMCWLFASSLYARMSLIERLARLREPALPPAGVRYTRRVTQIWSIFFALNALAALWTALYASLATWTLYNGVISYGLTAALMSIEFIVRQFIRKRHAS